MCRSAMRLNAIAALRAATMQIKMPSKCRQRKRDVAPSLAGAEEETLLDSLVLGAGDEVVTGVCVAGKWVVERSCPAAASH